MRLVLAAFAFAGLAFAAPASAQTRGADDGFDDRGYDRHDRSPDWNYRRGESEGRGAYYDGGRYGPAGIRATADDGLDPWLSDTAEVRELVFRRYAKSGHGRVKPNAAIRANDWFRRYADTDRNLRLTDAEIRIALVRVEKALR